MSKAFVDKIIAEIIAKGNTSKVYKRVRASSDLLNTHIVSVYKSSLKQYSKDIDVEATYNEIASKAVNEFGIHDTTVTATKITVVMPERYNVRL